VKDALAAAPVAATTAPNGAATPALPVQAMTVRLDLPEHGRIDVRVAARGNEVSLHLSAEREETVRKLAREHDAVVASLRDAGYDADIRAIAALRTADARGEPQSSPNGGASPSQSGKDDSSSNPQHSHQGEDRPRPSDRQPHANNRTDTRGAGGIYV
jgi:chemotaxis protein MotD